MCRPLGSNFRVILNPLLQTLLSDQSPCAVEGGHGCFSGLGFVCLGATFPADGVTGHAHRSGVRFSHVLSPVFAQGADWALGGCTLPQTVSSRSGSSSRTQAWRRVKGETTK